MRLYGVTTAWVRVMLTFERVVFLFLSIALSVLVFYFNKNKTIANEISAMLKYGAIFILLSLCVILFSAFKFSINNPIKLLQSENKE